MAINQQFKEYIEQYEGKNSLDYKIWVERDGKAKADSNTSFKKRRLEIRLTLHEGEFADGSNTKIITDLAIKANIQKLGAPDFGKASVEITGLTTDDMQELTTMSFNPMLYSRNYLTILAGNEGEGMSECYAGSITHAHADFNASPDIKFSIQSEISFWGRIHATGPNVIKGTVKAEDFIRQQIQKAGIKSFTCYDVSATLKDCVFNGTPIEQAKQAAAQIGAELVLDDNEAYLLGDGKSREGSTPLLSKETGLLGYPTITQNGVECKAIYDPAFKFAGLFELQTVVPKAAGTWRIVKLTHNLQANDPKGGVWESQITGFYPHLSGVVGRLV